MKKEYSFIAKAYDPLLYFFIHSLRKEVMNMILDYKEKSILDLCCGTGDQLKLLAKNNFKNLHCLDMSEDMLREAKKNNFNIKIYEEDAIKTNFSDESFDLILISFAVHEKDKVTQENFLNEAYRILKKNGSLLVLDYDFNKKTSILIKLIIYTIERIAGKEHYINFKNYIKNKGLLSLINTEKFKILENKQKDFRGTSIFFYKKV